MDFDELQRRWQEQDRALDKALRVNERLVQELAADKVRSAMERLTATLVIELVQNVVALMLIGTYLGAYGRTLRFFLPGATLFAAALLLVIATVALLVRIHGIDYAAPVVSIQQALESVRMARLRTTKWILILSPLLWTPLVIVLFHAVTRLDPYALFGRWLAANFAFGVLVIPLLLWLARRKRVRRLAHYLDGKRLAAARKFLASLAELEAEPR